MNNEDNYMKSKDNKKDSISNKVFGIPNKWGVRWNLDISTELPSEEDLLRYQESITNKVKEENSEFRKNILLPKQLEIYRKLNQLNSPIPEITHKKIRLTNAGKDNNVIISTNLLDSIAKYANKANLPILSALGLVGQETTFHYGSTDGNGMHYTPTNYINNWAYYDQNPYYELEVTVDKKLPYPFNGSLLEKAVYYKNQLEEYKKGMPYADRKAKNLKIEHPFLHGFKLYKTGRYNPGDPRHTKMVEDRGKALMQSPEILKWWKNEGYKWYE